MDGNEMAAAGADGRPTTPAETFTNVTADWVLIRAKMRKIYRVHRPEKLADIDELLVQWAGQEKELLAQIVEKYGAQQTQRLEASKLKVVEKHLAKRRLRRGGVAKETAADRVRREGRLKAVAAVQIQRLARGNLARARARLRAAAAAVAAEDAAEAAAEAAAAAAAAEAPLSARSVAYSDASTAVSSQTDSGDNGSDAGSADGIDADSAPALSTARSVESDASTAVSSQTESENDMDHADGSGDPLMSARSVESDASTAVSAQTESEGEEETQTPLSARSAASSVHSDASTAVSSQTDSGAGSDASTAVSAQTDSDDEDGDAGAEDANRDNTLAPERPKCRGFEGLKELRDELPAARGELRTPETELPISEAVMAPQDEPKDANPMTKKTHKKRRRKGAGKGEEDDDGKNQYTLKIVDAGHLGAKRERKYRKAEKIMQRVMVARIEVAWRIKVATRLRASHAAATELQRFVRGWHARRWIAQRLAATTIQYYLRRHIRALTNSRLNKLREGVVLLQRRWLERQHRRLDVLRGLAVEAAAAARWRTQRLIAMKNARACGVEAAALGVAWAKRKAEEQWQERYEALQRLTFAEARRRGAELQLDWALGVVRKSVMRRVSKKRLFRNIGRRQLKKMDTMSGLLLQSITDILVEGEEEATTSALDGEEDDNRRAHRGGSHMRRPSPSLSPLPAPNRRRGRRQPPGGRRGGKGARASAGLSAGYVVRRESMGPRGSLTALSTGVGIERDRSALQLRGS
jgi:hypothetical protein